MKEAPFVHVSDDSDQAYDGYTPSQVSKEMAKNWQEANQRRYYNPGVRLKKMLVKFDGWWNRHSVLGRVLLGLGIVAGIVAAVNLELGRPWF